MHTALPAATVNAELRDAIWGVDPAIERVTFRPLDDVLERGLADRRALIAFGGILLLIAAALVGAGLFASLSAALSESVHELAIRAALGATPVRLALQSMRWAMLAAGIAGVVAAAGVSVVAANIELEKAVLRPTWTSVTLCLLAMGIVTGAAAFRPARRASSVAPVDALREQ